MKTTVSLDIHCPKCKLPARAILEGKCHKFLLYTCPKCRSNVVYYNDKIDIISNKLLFKLVRKNKLQFCGNIFFNKTKKKPIKKIITEDDITNLKILLENCKDVQEVINRI